MPASPEEMTQTVLPRGVAEGLFGALTLSLHPAVDTQGIGADIVLDKAEVILVSDDHIRGLHGLEYGGGDILGATRPMPATMILFFSSKIGVLE